MIDKIIDFALKHRLLTVFLIALVCLWGVVPTSGCRRTSTPTSTPRWSRSSPRIRAWPRRTSSGSSRSRWRACCPARRASRGSGRSRRPAIRWSPSSSTGAPTSTMARQIVSSKLELITGRLPLGTSPPVLGPVSSRMGEVFEFAVVGDETVDPMELRSVADWTIRYQLAGRAGSGVRHQSGRLRQAVPGLPQARDAEALRHHHRRGQGGHRAEQPELLRRDHPPAGPGDS